MSAGQGEPIKIQRNAQAAPPAFLKSVYKFYQASSVQQLLDDHNIVDFQSDASDPQAKRWRCQPGLPAVRVRSVCEAFDALDRPTAGESPIGGSALHFAAYESTVLPGLFLYPALIPPRTQIQLLSRLLHRDLANPSHSTNVHLHYKVEPLPDERSCIIEKELGSVRADDKDQRPPSLSYFNYAPSSTRCFPPKNPSVHRPLPAPHLIAKKLRWMTLGGQYDWTSKTYPDGPPPPFPPDIAALVEGLFPQMKAQAAIINLYSPGDTLSLHRDVSEHCQRPLISVSLGCDGIFVAGPEAAEEQSSSAEGQESPECDGAFDAGKALVLRLRSGDVLCMSGPARFAWHGVPKIVADTCPSWMRDWPAPLPLPEIGGASDGMPANPAMEAWRGWMASKRINLNVRQMFD